MNRLDKSSILKPGEGRVAMMSTAQMSQEAGTELFVPSHKAEPTFQFLLSAVEALSVTEAGHKAQQPCVEGIYPSAAGTSCRSEVFFRI